MSSPLVNRALYAALCVMNLVIGAVILEIGRGTVPIPKEYEWTVPIILAALNGIALFLPRVGAEGIAQQVDILKARNVKRSDMVVVTQQEALEGIANAPPPDEGRMPPA